MRLTWFAAAPLALAALVFAGCASEKEADKPAEKPKGSGDNVSSPAPAANAAPAFSLPDPSGAKHALADYKGKWVVLEWVNHGCPFVVKHYGSRNMQAMQAKYMARGIVWLSICSSAPGKQGHQDNAGWIETLKSKGASPTAMLLDPDGTVGHAYEAKTTPHMFVIDPSGAIVYRGAIDDKPTADASDISASRNYVGEVLEAALAGKPVPIAESKPYGCSVKYK